MKTSHRTFRASWFVLHPVENLEVGDVVGLTPEEFNLEVKSFYPEPNGFCVTFEDNEDRLIECHFLPGQQFYTES